MSDQLEDFIRNHRSEMDIEEPSGLVWKGIEGEIATKKRSPIFKTMGIAASILVLITAGYWVGQQNGSQQLDQSLFASETQYQEFNEAEEFYTRTINYKIDEATDMGVDQDVLSDLQKLDEVYNELKSEMINSRDKDKEEIIKLLINNYKTKIDILELIINKTKNYKDEKSIDLESINI